jgi:hypothetical protein
MNPNLVGVKPQANVLLIRPANQKYGQNNRVTFGNTGSNSGTVKGKNLNAPDTEQLRQQLIQGLAPHLNDAMKRLTDSLSTNSMNYGKPLNNETFAAGQILASVSTLLANREPY